MPTVIPYQDATGELFRAYQTIQDVKQSAQKIAIDQALADSHIQSANTIDQLNQSRLQIEQQQAKEFTSPEGISRRSQTQDTALQQGVADLNRTNTQTSNMLDENPFHVEKLRQDVRRARILGDTSQQELNDLADKLKDDRDVRKISVQGMKYKMLTDYGMDGHTADLLSRVKGEELTQQLLQMPATFKARAAILEDTTKQLEQKNQLNFGVMQQHMAQIAAQVGVPAAKAIAAQMPGYEGWQDVPDDSMKMMNTLPDPKRQELAQMAALFSSSKTPQDVKDAIVENMGRNIAQNTSGWKPPTVAEMQSQQALKGTPFEVAPDNVLTNAKKIAEHILKNTKVNPKTGEALPPGMFSVEDQRTQFLGGGSGEKQPSAPIQSATYDINNPPNGLPANSTVVSPSTQLSQKPSTSNVVTKEASLKLDPKSVSSDFDRIEKFITKVPDEAGKTFVANRVEDPNNISPSVSGSERDSSAADALVRNASDPRFTIQPDGFVYDRATGEREHQVGLRRVTGESSIPDEEFRNRVSEKIRLGLRDPTASNAQAARFSGVMSQFAKAFTSHNKSGLTNVYDAVRQKYSSPGTNGMTVDQLKLINSLMAEYGLYNQKR